MSEAIESKLENSIPEEVISVQDDIANSDA